MSNTVIGFLILNSVLGFIASFIMPELWIGFRNYLRDREVDEFGQFAAYTILGQLWVLIVLGYAVIMFSTVTTRFIRGCRSLYRTLIRSEDQIPQARTISPINGKYSYLIIRVVTWIGFVLIIASVVVLVRFGIFGRWSFR